MRVTRTTNEGEWEEFLRAQPWSPFLQSWAMGEVYRAVGEEPVRLEIRGASTPPFDSARQSQLPCLAQGSAQHDTSSILGICQAIVVPAKRGRHLAALYGPVFDNGLDEQLLVTGYRLLVEELKKVAREHDCAFVRVSPFCASTPCFDSPRCAGLAQHSAQHDTLTQLGFRPAPLHMLAEHIWYLGLRGKSEEDILRGMRQTTRNLIRRAEREGVVVESSDDPVRDLPIFFELYEETRRRHRFVPYPQSFIQAQVERFAPMRQCALYIARFRSEPVAASVHMIYGGETSYHHGASTARYPKVPASHLLQWRAIQDALRRGDRIYNFWGIAPLQSSGNPKSPAFAEATAGLRLRGRSDSRSRQIPNPKHPFAGVTTFKTGFGGQLLTLQHCMDLPLSPRYWITFGIETARKWRRGF